MVALSAQPSSPRVGSAPHSSVAARCCAVRHSSPLHTGLSNVRRLEAKAGFLAEASEVIVFPSRVQFSNMSRPSSFHTFESFTRIFLFQFPFFEASASNEKFFVQAARPPQVPAFPVRRSGRGTISAALMCTYEDKSRMQRTHMNECQATSQHSCEPAYVRLSSGPESEANDTNLVVPSIQFHILCFLFPPL